MRKLKAVFKEFSRPFLIALLASRVSASQRENGAWKPQTILNHHPRRRHQHSGQGSDIGAYCNVIDPRSCKSSLSLQFSSSSLPTRARSLEHNSARRAGGGDGESKGGRGSGEGEGSECCAVDGNFAIFALRTSFPMALKAS